MDLRLTAAEGERLELLRAALRLRSGVEAVRAVLALDPAKVAQLVGDPGAIIGALDAPTPGPVVRARAAGRDAKKPRDR